MTPDPATRPHYDHRIEGVVASGPRPVPSRARACAMEMGSVATAIADEAPGHGG